MRCLKGVGLAIGLLTSSAFAIDFNIPEWTAREMTRLSFKADLRTVRRLALEVDCEDPSALRGCTCHFFTTNGNYSIPFDVTRSGRSTILLDRVGVKTFEGSPRGWGAIDGALISFWNAGAVTTQCAAVSLKPQLEVRPKVLVVMTERDSRQYDWRLRLVKSLDALEISSTIVSADDLTDETIAGFEMVALPGKPKLAPEKTKVIADYKARGGVVFTQAWKGLIPGENVESFARLISEIMPAWKSSIERVRALRRSREQSARLELQKRFAEKGVNRRICCHCAGGFEGAGSWLVADDMRSWDWDRTAAELKARGITELEVNFCRAGTAWYRSRVLPMASDLEQTGDRLEQALAACRRYGLKLRAWRVCWNIGEKNLHTAECEVWMTNGLAQVSNTGKIESKFLCPTAPENRQREIEAMVELASKGVDSVSFDYIRYPDRQHCFCARCRAAFEAQYGAVTNWPNEVRGEDARARQWTQFRHQTISGVVKEAAERIHREYPGVEVCAAVMGDAEGLFKNLGQPWGAWVRAGWLDSVAPMDYVEDPERLRQLIRRQKASVPVEKIVPTLGPSLWVDDGLNAELLTKQIDVLKEEGITQYGIFQLDYRTMNYMRVDN